MENTLEIKKPSKREYVYFRQRQKDKVFQSVIAYFAKQAEEQGLAKKDLARLLEKDPAQITRWFKGPGNWELDTISDLLLAMGAEMEFEIVPLDGSSTTEAAESLFVAGVGAANGDTGGGTQGIFRASLIN